MKFIKDNFDTIINNKKIAILLATFNSKQYICDMINSLMEQSFDDFCVFVHDDGSTDDTLTVLGEYEKKHPDSFVILNYPKTGSAKANFFSMMEAVKSDYYMFADHDDVWLKDKINLTYEKLLEISEDDATPTCVFTDMYVTDSNLNIMSDSFIRFIGRDPYNHDYHRLIIDNPAAGCTMLLNKAMRDKALECNDISKIEMHDHFILTLAAIIGKIGYVDLPLSYYRQHGDNVMGAGQSESKKDKLLRNIRELFNGTFLRTKREFNSKARFLAGQLAAVSGLPDIIRTELEDLANIGNAPKFKRISFYKKHGFNRKDNNVWFYLWL